MTNYIDISLIKVDDVYFKWLSPLCAATKPEYIIISPAQSRLIFSSGAGEFAWTAYRGITLKVKDVKEVQQ